MARTSVVPDAIDALVSIATTALPAVRVIDGYDLSEDPSDMLMIGCDDPNSPTWAKVASAQQNWANATKQGRDEIATISCVAVSYNGDSDQRSARLAVYGFANTLGDAIRANHTLAVAGTFPNGIPGVWKTNFAIASDLTQILNDDGAVAILAFTIQVFARI